MKVASSVVDVIKLFLWRNLDIPKFKILKKFVMKSGPAQNSEINPNYRQNYSLIRKSIIVVSVKGEIDIF